MQDIREADFKCILYYQFIVYVICNEYDRHIMCVQYELKYML